MVPGTYECRGPDIRRRVERRLDVGAGEGEPFEWLQEADWLGEAPDGMGRASSSGPHSFDGVVELGSDLIDPPVVVSPRGTIAVPESPGIGHEIVWSRVDKATLHRLVWP